MPWLHAHSARIEGGAADLVLAQHLSRFHRTAAPDRELGWHMHFAPLVDLFGVPCDEHAPARGDSSPCQIAAGEFAEVRLIECRPHDGAFSTIRVRAMDGGVESPEGPERCPRNFFATFRESTPIPVLICLARC